MASPGEAVAEAAADEVEGAEEPAAPVAEASAGVAVDHLDLAVGEPAGVPRRAEEGVAVVLEAACRGHRAPTQRLPVAGVAGAREQVVE